MSEAPRRIILVNRVYWPSTAATAQLLTDLAEGLAARGWSVEVIAAGQGDATRSGVTIHRTGGTDRHGGLVSRALNYGSFRRAAQRLLRTLVRPGDVVVPMTDPPLLGPAVTGVALARGGRVVPWVQDIYPEILSAHLGSWVAGLLAPLRRQRDQAWQRAAHCVTLGQDLAQTVLAAGVPAERIAVIPNWAPREVHAPPEAAAVAARRQAWGLTDQFVVAYSGNLGRVHEFNAVIEAATRLKGRRDIVFAFIGTGARFDEVRAAARARGLGQVRLFSPEPRENLAAALAAADAHLVTLKPAFARLVYPSKLAGVLAAGRPVLFVGPGDGGIARLLQREDCGEAVGPADGAKLADLIATWRAQPETCARLGRNGRRAYERHFTFDAALERWEAVLRPTAPDAQLPTPAGGRSMTAP